MLTINEHKVRHSAMIFWETVEPGGMSSGLQWKTAASMPKLTNEAVSRRMIDQSKTAIVRKYLAALTRWFCAANVAAGVAMIVVLTSTAMSVAHAQTRASVAASPGTNSQNLTVGGEVNAMNVLLADLRSPDFVRRERAAYQIWKISQQGQRTIGGTLLAIARKQVQEVKEDLKKQPELGATRTPAEEKAEEAARTAIYQKAEIAARTIRLLGDLQIKESIPFLLENIRFLNFNTNRRAYNFPYTFPCLGALMTIGLPAADATLSAIEAGSLDLDSAWPALLLSSVLGAHTAIGLIDDRIDLLKLTSHPSSTSSQAARSVAVSMERLQAVRVKLENIPRDPVGYVITGKKTVIIGSKAARGGWKRVMTRTLKSNEAYRPA